MTEVMELNWTESKQDNNKNYTKTLIDKKLPSQYKAQVLN